MRKISKLSSETKEYPFYDLWKSYFYSYFLLFLIRNKIYDGESKVYVLKGEILKDLQNSVLNALEDILNNGYSEPSQSDIQKNPTRYEKFRFNERLYRVNYRLSESGRLAYYLYSFDTLIQEAALNNGEIRIECE
jgi:hypothetical protein